MNVNKNVTVKELKALLNTLPDEMNVITPIALENNPNSIQGYRQITSVGILSNEYMPESAVCIAALENGMNISEAAKATSAICEKLLC